MHKKTMSYIQEHLDRLNTELAWTASLIRNGLRSEQDIDTHRLMGKLRYDLLKEKQVLINLLKGA